MREAFVNYIDYITEPLAAPVALPASNITLDSFRANWEEISAPKNLTTSYVGYSSTDLTWTVPDSGKPDRYNIYRETELIKTVPGFLTTFSDTIKLQEGGSYLYTVRAVKGIVESPDSNAKSVQLNTPPVTGNRVASATDAANIKNCNVGDVIYSTFTNANNSIFINGGSLDFPVQAPNKILIRGQEYFYIRVTLDNSEGNIVITNYDGQVYVNGGRGISADDRFHIGGTIDFKLTGKYDPVAQTGDPNYLGHANGYAWTQGTYGFLFDHQWNNVNRAGLDIETQTNHEIEYIEVCNGGFAGISDKLDSPPDPTIPAIINIHDNYIHDTYGEGIYTGHFSTSISEHLIKGEVYNNRFIRNGNEAIQTGNLGNAFRCYNNIVALDSMARMNPFQRYHTNGVQMVISEGEYEFYKNIVLGVGEAFTSHEHQSGQGVENASRKATVRDNFFSHSKNFGTFLFPNDQHVTPIEYLRNTYKNIDFSNDDLYNTTDPNSIFQINNTQNSILIKDNKYDNRGGRELIGQGKNNSNVTQSGNVGISDQTIPFFVNSGYPVGFDFREINFWSARKGEKAGFTDYTGWKTVPGDVVGSLNIGNISQGQWLDVTNIQLGRYTGFTGEQIRIYDRNNPYDNFMICTLLAVDTTNSRIQVSTSSKEFNAGTYSAVSFDKEKAFRTFNQGQWQLHNSIHYEMIFTGDKALTAGREPGADGGVYWQKIQWEGNDYPPDDWSVDQTNVTNVIEGWNLLGIESISQSTDTPLSSVEYLLYVSDDNFQTFLPGFNGKEVSGGFDLVPGLESGVIYKYKLKAVDGSRVSEFSNTITVLTVDMDSIIPVALPATEVTIDRFTAHWQAEGDIDGFIFELSTDNVDFTSQDVGLVNSFPVTGVEGTQYYRVRAYNEFGTSGYSNVITVNLAVPTLEAPTALPATNVQYNSFTAHSSEVEDAEQYEYEVSKDNFATSLKFTGGTSFIVPADPGTLYKYRIRAKAEGFNTSPPSNVVEVWTNIRTPYIVSSLISTTSTTITIGWDLMTGTDEYGVEISRNSDFTDLVHIDAVSSPTKEYTFTDLEPFTGYYVRIRGARETPYFVTPYSDVKFIATEQAPVLAAPVALAADQITAGAFRARWTHDNGTSFVIQYSKDNFQTIQNKTVGDTRDTVTSGLEANTDYKYRVQAKRDNYQNSAYSNTISFYTKPPKSTFTDIILVTSTELRFYWTPVSGIDWYHLEISTDPNFNTIVGQFVEASLTEGSFWQLQEDTDYFLRISTMDLSRGELNRSEYSYISARTGSKPVAPILFPATDITFAHFKISWSETGNDYELQVATDANFTNMHSSWGSTVESVEVMGLNPDTDYWAQVRSIGINGETSDWSNAQKVTTKTLDVRPDAPVLNPATEVDTSSFRISWSAETGATEYRIDVATDSNFVLKLGNYTNRQVLGISLNVTGLSNGVDYYVRVRAVGDLVSDNSNVRQVKTRNLPIINEHTDNFEGSTNVLWDVVDGITDYEPETYSGAFFNTLEDLDYFFAVAGGRFICETVGLEDGKTYKIFTRWVDSNGNKSKRSNGYIFTPNY